MKYLMTKNFKSLLFICLCLLLIQILFSKVWTLSISPNGKYVVTSGHDKTLRLWEKTQEPLVLDDEREIEREKEEEEQLATGN